MTDCRYCGKPGCTYIACRECFYDGAVLTENFIHVINLLERVTGTPWQGEHTGGGCAWLATRIPKDGGDEQLIAITFDDDTFHLTTTFAEVDRAYWGIGAYSSCYEDSQAVFFRCSTEEVMGKVREAHEILKGQI